MVHIVLANVLMLYVLAHRAGKRTFAGKTLLMWPQRARHTHT